MITQTQRAEHRRHSLLSTAIRSPHPPIINNHLRIFGNKLAQKWMHLYLYRTIKYIPVIIGHNHGVLQTWEIKQILDLIFQGHQLLLVIISTTYHQSPIDGRLDSLLPGHKGKGKKDEHTEFICLQELIIKIALKVTNENGRHWSRSIVGLFQYNVKIIKMNDIYTGFE